MQPERGNRTGRGQQRIERGMFSSHEISANNSSCNNRDCSLSNMSIEIDNISAGIDLMIDRCHGQESRIFRFLQPPSSTTQVFSLSA